MPGNLRQQHRQLKVRRFDKRRARTLGTADSIALGFAWPAPNTGGVRRHLECIEQYSSFPVSLYPGSYACQLLVNGAERGLYHQNLGTELVERHALFHSHVDPEFVRLSRLAQRKGKPWVHTYHALYFAEDWGGHLAQWQVDINDCLASDARQADVCLAVNTWLADWLKSKLCVESRFLPNGVDVELCDRAEGGRFSREYELSDFVLFVGSIAKIKNPLAYIEAARKLPSRSFVMIGTGLSRTTIEQTYQLELPKNISPLGPLSHELTLDAIAACRALVMTSHREGLPTVLLEAMAMRKPCVVPHAPWFVDAIPTDQFGLRYHLGELDDLAEKIEAAMQSGTQSAARERVEEHFSWPVVVRQLDEIYRELLG